MANNIQDDERSKSSSIKDRTTRRRIFTIDEVKALLPRGSKSLINNDIIAAINRCTDNDEEDFAAIYRENFVSFSSVLKSSKFSLPDYISAVKYVSYRLMGDTSIDSYMKTFPDRYNRLMEKWVEHYGSPELVRSKKIAAYATGYSGTQLVSKVMEQSMIPPEILNAPLHQQSINVLADIMLHGVSEKNRVDAAKAVREATAPSATSRIKIDIGVNEGESIKDLRDYMNDLRNMQHQAIVDGIATPKMVAEANIIEALTCDEDDEEES
jgi:hypothetical protein